MEKIRLAAAAADLPSLRDNIAIWAGRLELSLACDQLDANIAWDLASNIISLFDVQVRAEDEAILLELFVQQCQQWKSVLAGCLLCHRCAVKFSGLVSGEAFFADLLENIWRVHCGVCLLDEETFDARDLADRMNHLYQRLFLEIFSGCKELSALPEAVYYFTKYCQGCISYDTESLSVDSSTLARHRCIQVDRPHPTLCMHILASIWQNLATSKELTGLSMALSIRNFESARNLIDLIDCTQTNSIRAELIKRLMKPFLDFVAEKVPLSSMSLIVETVWSCSLQIQLVYNDLANASMMLCLLFKSLNGAASEYFLVTASANKELWNCIMVGMLHNDGTVRKRAAFLLQHIACASREGKRIVQGTWPSQYLLVYNQIEGSNSLHLINQIWPIFEKLCMSAVRQTDHDASKMSFPSISFPWIKSILHCLLQCQVPAIRRVALYKIFSGQVPVVVNAETISWLCQELLADWVDSITYFSAYFIGPGQDLGCHAAVRSIAASQNTDSVLQFPADLQLSINEKIMSCSSGLNPATSPGVLLPSYLAAMFAVCQIADKDDSRLASCLVQSLLQCFCRPGGVASLSAVKWILRVFCEDSVQPMIPRCLDYSRLHDLKHYISSKLLASNGVVKAQIFQSLTPLLFCAFSSAGVVDNTFTTSTAVICNRNVCIMVQIIVEQIGLDAVISHHGHLRLLKTALLEFNNSANGARQSSVTQVSIERDQYFNEWYYYGIAASALPDPDVVTDTADLGSLRYMSRAAMSNVSKLYSSPYLPADTVIASLGFAAGVLECVDQSVEVILNYEKSGFVTACRYFLSVSLPLGLGQFPR
jgi:hypothetical protein